MCFITGRTHHKVLVLEKLLSTLQRNTEQQINVGSLKRLLKYLLDINTEYEQVKKFLNFPF